MRTMKKMLGCALVLLCCVLWMAVPAQAGIIITEGKIAEEADASKSAQTTRRGVASENEKEGEGEAEDTLPCSGDLDEDGLCINVEGAVDSSLLDGLEDLDADDPEGWDCAPLGGGLELCEPSGGVGSAPGAGAGGGLGSDAGLEGPQVGGCQGGQSGAPWLGLLLLVGLFALRREPQGRFSSLS